MIKKMMFFMVSGLVLMFTSCGDQHKAQSLVKDFLNENLVEQDFANHGIIHYFYNFQEGGMYRRTNR